MTKINPLTPDHDEHVISPFNIHIYIILVNIKDQSSCQGGENILNKLLSSLSCSGQNQSA